MRSINFKRVTIYAGHYGSGKTNLTVNQALCLRGQGTEVSVIDLDIVNPYFRTKDSEELFVDRGIRLISSKFANSNLDIPSIPAAANSAFDDHSRHVVIDLGGDDAGAIALGRYSGMIDPDETDMFLVLNRCRPMTRTPEQALEMKHDIESASRFGFTGIVNNTNLGSETDEALVLDSVGFAQEVSRLTVLPVVFTSVVKRLFKPLEGKIENLVPIDIYGGSAKFNV